MHEVWLEKTGICTVSTYTVAYWYRNTVIIVSTAERDQTLKSNIRLVIITTL